jgi:HlyD family secretion protein
MKRRRVITWGIVAIVLLAAIELTRAARSTSITSTDDELPIALVKRGDLDLKVYTTGELHATQSMTVTAPPIGGGALQITRLVHTGAPVKKGDLVMEFDPSEQRYTLEQSRSDLLQAEQEIIKAKADAAVQTAQDKVALLKARFDVRRAQLDVQKNELASTIDATKNQLALDQAKRALAELEQDIKSHATSGQAGIGLAQEKWNKATLSMEQAKQNIEKMRVVSPIEGLVAIQKNLDSTGGMFFEGATFPDYHEGDQAQPGSAVALVIDPREMELTAKISELERSNIKIGQRAEIEFDAWPGEIFQGKVKTAAGMVQRQFWDTEGGGKYDISIQLVSSDPRFRPGLTAQIVVLGDKKANALYVPRQALFQKSGKQVVYLKDGKNFEQRPVSIQGENESRAAITGLKAGDEVALVDPTAPRKGGSSAAAAPGVAGGPP